MRARCPATVEFEIAETRPRGRVEGFVVLAEPLVELAHGLPRGRLELAAVDANGVVVGAEMLLRGAGECVDAGRRRFLNAGPVGRDCGFEIAETRLPSALECRGVIVEPPTEFADAFTRGRVETRAVDAERIVEGAEVLL